MTAIKTMIELNTIYHECCLTGMERIRSKSVDMVLADLPYGTTACHWDSVIPFAPLWAQYERIIKDDGAIVLTAAQPFTTEVICSNKAMFRYSLVWNKKMPVGFYNAKKQPLRVHEDILIFAKGRTVYNPQMRTGQMRNKKVGGNSDVYSFSSPKIDNYNDQYYPTSIIEVSNAQQTGKVHPTQKPVALFEYLINTYTNPGGAVLDNVMGSGTTAIACMNTGRNFIGFEKEEKYFNLCLSRIEEHKIRQSDKSKTLTLFKDAV